MTKTVLVTGADGFVGHHACAELAARGARVVRAVRQAHGDPSSTVVIGDIAAPIDWPKVVRGVDAVVHLAAVTHAKASGTPDVLKRFTAVNVDATLALARAAQREGAGRFVYMSSIKVNGERSERVDGRTIRFTPSDRPAPEDAYGRTKWQAEQALAELDSRGVFDVVVLRAPLVYGPGQKGNLLSLLRWIASGRPLPFANVDNLRSLIYSGNLADAVADAALGAGDSAGTYTLADVDISTPDLVRALGRALHVRPRLIAVPERLLSGLLRVAGKADLGMRLTGSLIVDSTLAHERLGWRPRVPFDAAMQQTGEWYLRRRR